MSELWAAYREGLLVLLEDGGDVMPALFAVAFAMWALIAWRALIILPGGLPAADKLWKDLSNGQAGSRRGLLRQAVGEVYAKHSALVGLATEARAHAIRLCVAPMRQQLARHRTTTLSLITSGPLLGLLGTVSGMIETFDALGRQALLGQSGGIAGGIAEALLTTQVGLFIAIPGTLAARMIDRRESALQDQLVHLEHVMHGWEAEA